MVKEPERVVRLQENGQAFLRLAKEAGPDTGTSQGFAIVPVITGSSLKAVKLSNRLFEQGINVQPIVYLSCLHTEAQINRTVEMVKELA